MNAIAIGPFVFASEQFAAILGIFTFTIATSVLAPRRPHHRAMIDLGVDRRPGRCPPGHVAPALAKLRGRAHADLRLLAGRASSRLPALSACCSSACSSSARSRPGLLPQARSASASCCGSAQPNSPRPRSVSPPRQSRSANGTVLFPLAVSDIDRQARTVVNLWASWCPPCRRKCRCSQKSPQAATTSPSSSSIVGEGSETIRAYLAKAEP